jgi:hypothetical protein
MISYISILECETELMLQSLGPVQDFALWTCRSTLELLFIASEHVVNVTILCLTVQWLDMKAERAAKAYEDSTSKIRQFKADFKG